MALPPIVAAIDPVTQDRGPAALAALIAGFTGAPVQVAGVAAYDAAVTRLTGGQQGEDLPSESSDVLELIAADLVGDGVDADPLPLAASTVPRALELALQELGASLLVVGSSAGAPRGRVAPGDVGRRLLHGMPCSVAIAPAGWERPRALGTVGAGFVDSAEGRAAVETAGALADRAGAALRILTAVLPRAWMGGTADDLEAELRTLAEQAAAGSIRAPVDERVDIDVVVGEPADVLAEASTELDLLVCGARAYGARPAVQLGGVTQGLVQRAACPVVVLAGGTGPPWPVVP